MTYLYTGSGVAIITPFKKDTLEIDYQAMGDLLDFHIAHETDAIIVTGTTGESATLSDKEKIALIKYTVDYVDGRLPVIAGTGTNNTMQTIELSKAAQLAGVDGLLIVTPYYNRTNEAGMLKHFETIANNVQIPIILYHVPSRTNAELSVEQVIHLANHKNIVGIKDATGDMHYTKEIIARRPKHFAVYSGNDDLNYTISLVGGQGAISVTANVMPEEVHQVIQYGMKQKENAGQALSKKMENINDDLFIEVNPIPIKYMMSELGYCELAYRLPLCEPTEATKQILNHYVEELNEKYKNRSSYESNN